MFKIKESYKIEDLREIMTLLRSPDGCPWDKVQTHQTIRMSLLEEAYEVMEAIDAEDDELIAEELGDLLLQIVFHSELGREKRTFDFDNVCDMICKKLIYRHPHVFGETNVNSEDDVLKNWDALKSKSKEENTVTERLLSVPKLLPSLMRGEKVSKRAENAGFHFGESEEIIDRLKNEINKLEISVFNKNDVETDEVFGDILFTCCNLAVFLKKDGEKALTSSINKFIMRFRTVERLADKQGKKISEMSRDELDMLWKKAETSAEG